VKLFKKVIEVKASKISRELVPDHFADTGKMVQYKQ